MSALATRIEREAGRPLTPIEIFNISASRETTLSRLLTLYICTGLAFMLLPGTFLGVWNLIAISSRQSTQTVSPAWIQAHGHAQIFGWIGTFIFGHWLSFHTQVTPRGYIRHVGSMGLLGSLDIRRRTSLVYCRLSLAMAHPVAAIGGV